MHTAAVGVTEKEDREEGMHEQDMFDRVVSFLPTITRFLFNSVLGADDPPFRPVMGKRGDIGGAATGVSATDADSSATGATTVAASASETPSRCARAASERAGASPRVRKAARSTGSRAWIH